MDDIFRLRGRSFGFLGYGELASVAEDRLRENAEADGYAVHWHPSEENGVRTNRSDGSLPSSPSDTTRLVHELSELVEKRIRASGAELYEGPRDFYYLGLLHPYIDREDREELLRISRLARYSGVCIGVRIAMSDKDAWSGIPLYAGRTMGSMMVWERLNPGELP